MTTTLRITLTDEKLIRKVRSIPKQERGRILQRALKVYFATTGGREVCQLFSKEERGVASRKKDDTSKRRNSPDKLKDVLGDF
jgi:hypothetical protein